MLKLFALSSCLNPGLSPDQVATFLLAGSTSSGVEHIPEMHRHRHNPPIHICSFRNIQKLINTPKV